MTEGKRKRALRGRAGRMKGGRGSGRASTGQVRLWGRHPVEAALKNPDRQHRKLWATREGIASLDGELPQDFPIEYADVADLGRLVARDAPHQGLVLECSALEDVFLDEIATGEADRPVVVLDQVTDPHNVGAILRSAAAFNAAAIVTQDRHAPPESGGAGQIRLGRAGNRTLGAGSEPRPRARGTGRGRILAHRDGGRSRSDAGRCHAHRAAGNRAGRRRGRPAPQHRWPLRCTGEAADFLRDRKPECFPTPLRLRFMRWRPAVRIGH